MPDPTTPDPTTTPLADQPTEPGRTPAVEPKDGEAKTVELTINGDKRLYTEEELRRHAQQHLAGDDKLREAANFRKTTLEDMAALQQDAKVGALLTKAYNNKDAEAYKDLLVTFGHDEQAAIAAAKEMSVTPSETNAPTNDQPVRTSSDPKVAEMEQQLAEQADELTRLTEAQNARSTAAMEVELREKVKGLVDNDETLGYIVKRAGPRADQLQTLAWRAVERRIIDAAARGETVMDANLLTDAIAEVRSTAKALGLTTQLVPHIPGLAPTPQTASDFHPEKPPERKPMSDKDYGASLTDRMRHRLVASALQSG